MHIFKLIPAGLCVLIAFSLPNSIAKTTETNPIALRPVATVATLQEPKLVEMQELATENVEVATAPLEAHSDDYYLDWIAQHESSGNPYAMNEIGACGLFQSLPCSKVLSKCGSLDNIACQQEWGLEYALSRYGSTEAAYNFWQLNRYW